MAKYEIFIIHRYRYGGIYRPSLRDSMCAVAMGRMRCRRHTTFAPLLFTTETENRIENPIDRNGFDAA